MKRISIGAAGLVVGLIVALALPSFAAASVGPGATSPRPHIVATPNNVMVNTTITLVGRGFPARTKLTIEECSRTGWVVVAQKPCDSDNAVSIRTNRHGRFTSPFKVELCPRSKSGHHVTQERCHIGNPQPQGVDTITLVGAARITVTYP